VACVKTLPSDRASLETSKKLLELRFYRLYSQSFTNSQHLPISEILLAVT
jgi:hypothetical protein